MASLYSRQNSPYWWIKWRDPESGKIRRQGTKFRVGYGPDRRKALHLRNTLALKETKFQHSPKQEYFSAWVSSFLEAKFTGMTLERAGFAWEKMCDYLTEHKLVAPSHVKREHCIGYITWRTEGDVKKHRRPISRNTAMTELAFFSGILTEAVKREFIEYNPARLLRLKRPTPKPKLEITNEEIDRIRRGIETLESNLQLLKDLKKVWTVTIDPKIFLRSSFEIAIHQGCRLSETYIDLYRDVDLLNKTITFHAKGDEFYTAPLHPDLIPFLEELRAKGRRTSYDIPENVPILFWKKMAALYWHKFFKNLGMPHLSFHCTRVTVASKLARAGAPERVAMKLLNHSSTTVHRIYVRMNDADISSFWPRVSSGTPSRPENQDSIPTTGAHPKASHESHTS